MAQLEPPPRNVEKWGHIWKEWLHRLYSFVFGHTGGSTPTSPATGTSWNAHGNTATGTHTSPLVIATGSFMVGPHIINSGTGGENPYTHTSGQESVFIWAADKAALRAGTVSNTDWDTVLGGTIALGTGADSSGVNTVAIGNGTKADGTGCTSVGNTVETDGLFRTGIGAHAYASGNSGATTSGGAIGYSVEATGINSWVLGSGTNPISGRLTNSIDNSMMFGIGSTSSTMLLKSGLCGIANDTPLSTLDIGGSVGYGQTIVTATDGSGDVDFTYTAGQLTFSNDTATTCSITRSGGQAFDTATYVTGKDIQVINSNGSDDWYYYVTGVTDTVLTLDGQFNTATSTGARIYQAENQSSLTDELVSMVDLSTAPTYDNSALRGYTLHLPDISTVDGRMYHLIGINIDAFSGNEYIIRIRPDYSAGDTISPGHKITGAAYDGYDVSIGNSAQIVADATNSTWWII